MQELAWPIVFLIFIVLANYRLGQYLNPPFEQALADFKFLYEKEMLELRREVADVKQKNNAIMVDRGFK